MLQRIIPSRPTNLIEGSFAEERSSSDEIDLARLFEAARRQTWLVALCGLVGLILSMVYIVAITPFYTGTASIIIDNRQLRATKDVAALTDPITNPDIVDSVVEILKSEKIALGVINDLKLLDEPQFIADDTPTYLKVRYTLQGWVDISRWFGGGGSSDGDDGGREARYRLERAAVGTLLRNLEVTRKSRTWVIEIVYASSNAQRAARVANAFAEAYVNEQASSAFQATRRATSWLERRLDELRRQSSEADLSAETFRAENRLVATNGNLVLDQQLSQLSTQLSEARAAGAEAEARYRHIRSALEAQRTDAVVTESLTSSVVTDLRKKWTELSRQLADLTARKYGPEHQQVANVRNEMREYNRLIFEELGRIASSYESTWEIARTREASLEEKVAELERSVGRANVARVQLRQLEQQADSYRNLYNIYLSRYQEAVQQESFPLTEARIITPATKGLQTTYPRKPLVLGLGLFLGLAFGVGLGGLREALDRTFRTGDQVRDQLEALFLGYLPVVADDQSLLRWSPRRLIGSVAQHERKVMSYSTDFPLSVFAENLRRIKVATDLGMADSNSKVIAVTSGRPGEGKSTVSINLARLLAKQGASTLLIDADLRASRITRAMRPDCKTGLFEVVCEGVSTSDVILHERDTGLRFLPAGGHRNVVLNTSEILSSERMRALLHAAKRLFTYIVIDLPPAGTFADSRAMEPLVDTYVLVVEWGKGSFDIARNALDGEFGIRHKLGGVVLNKVRMNRLRMYGAHTDSY
jgi:succinoglycan biosynthesis transport protein ExoP